MERASRAAGPFLERCVSYASGVAAGEGDTLSVAADECGRRSPNTWQLIAAGMKYFIQWADTFIDHMPPQP
jgi:hypothetical protein